MNPGGDIAPSGDTQGRLEPSWHPLPTIRFDEAVRALQRLTPAELQMALRERVFPVAWSPHVTLLAAAGAEAEQRAWNRGQMISALIAPREFLPAAQHICRRALIEDATGGLKRRAPSLSAHRRLTGGQAFAAGTLALSVAAIAWWSPSILGAAASCLFALFFLAVVALRLMSLLPPRNELPPPPPLRDPDLPHYTVLVPLFRETSVLGQLLTALKHLDYPVLCSSLT